LPLGSYSSVIPEVFWVNGKPRFRKIGQPFRQCRVTLERAARDTCNDYVPTQAGQWLVSDSVETKREADLI
jgi:hypothetical protein